MDSKWDYLVPPLELFHPSPGRDDIHVTSFIFYIWIGNWILYFDQVKTDLF